MKITVINGTARHGSTWNCMDALRQALSAYEEPELTEFFLPKDMPHFCSGCFSCFLNGEETCPHAASVVPIADAILQADVVILTSPVYGMDISGQLKALLDHLCFMWMSHRPDARMFHKVGVVISTAAGAGLGHTAKTMKYSLKFWGVKKIYSFQNSVGAMKWDDVSLRKQDQIRKDAAVLAKRIAKSAKHIDTLPNPIFRSFFFWMMTGMMRKNTWNPRDRNYWESQGWLTGRKPFG